MNKTIFEKKQPMPDMLKTYEPREWEKKLSQQWERSGYCNPDKCVADGFTSPEAAPFSIVLPPPNATGHLHVGHAAMLAIEDTLIRFYRMSGYRTLWLPGTDHAAIATQEKVERILYKEEGKTRHDLGREKFLDRVHDFVEKSRSVIKSQVRAMGSSVDWSREAYTLDKQRHRAVNTAFKQMYNDGIIYRGDRIVNWDPKLQTTVSDDELERKTETAPFYYLQYGPFVIGTSRPETKFGDKYIVVHPDDKRYAHYEHNQKISVEWIGGVITATVIKDTAIDMEFGSGAMTITPWHDPIDFEIAQRHNLEKEQIIDYDGKLLEIAGKDFAGLDIFEARKKLIEQLSRKGLVVSVDENYSHNVAINSRGKGYIEPQIMRQWFVDVNRPFERNSVNTTLKTLMLEAVKSNSIEIIPKRFEKTYFHWIENLRDWCISRQIWYGHRIPVWYARNGLIACVGDTPSDDKDLIQDPDTLDTWFSSGLWTFSTLGWPDVSRDTENPQKNDLCLYHPNSVLETGYDILFFWVARMILMSTYLLDEVPFRKVYLHGLIRDEQGRKMSKSLDNTIDPLDVIDEYGTDALRLALLIGSTPGNDVRLGKEKIATFRNFTNKLWNIGRYVYGKSEKTPFSEKTSLSEADQWILERLSATMDRVTENIKSFQLSLAGETLRDFTWNEFADWYVEIHKIEKNDAVLRYVFETLLALWHPFMPFVSEALYQLGKNETQSHQSRPWLMVTSWPDRHFQFDKKNSSFEDVLSFVKQIRNIRAVYRIAPNLLLDISIPNTIDGSDSRYGDTFKSLARVGNIVRTDAQKKDGQCAQLITDQQKAFVHLDDIIDVSTEKKRLETDLILLQKHAENTRKRLSDKAYLEKAPSAIIEQSREQLKTLEFNIEQTKSFIDQLSS